MRRRHEARAASGEQQRGTQGPVLHHVGGTLPNGPMRTAWEPGPPPHKALRRCRRAARRQGAGQPPRGSWRGGPFVECLECPDDNIFRCKKLLSYVSGIAERF